MLDGGNNDLIFRGLLGGPGLTRAAAVRSADRRTNDPTHVSPGVNALQN